MLRKFRKAYIRCLRIVTCASAQQGDESIMEDKPTTPAQYMIDNPTNDIFQIPKFWALDRGAGRIYSVDGILGISTGLPALRTERV